MTTRWDLASAVVPGSLLAAKRNCWPAGRARGCGRCRRPRRRAPAAWWASRPGPAGCARPGAAGRPPGPAGARRRSRPRASGCRGGSRSAGSPCRRRRPAASWLRRGGPGREEQAGRPGQQPPGVAAAQRPAGGGDPLGQLRGQFPYNHPGPSGRDCARVTTPSWQESHPSPTAASGRRPVENQSSRKVQIHAERHTGGLT
jgi:hypothetical protein